MGKVFEYFAEVLTYIIILSFEQVKLPDTVKINEVICVFEKANLNVVKTYMTR